MELVIRYEIWVFGLGLDGLDDYAGWQMVLRTFDKAEADEVYAEYSGEYGEENVSLEEIV